MGYLIAIIVAIVVVYGPVSMMGWGFLLAAASMAVIFGLISTRLLRKSPGQSFGFALVMAGVIYAAEVVVLVMALTINEAGIFLLIYAVLLGICGVLFFRKGKGVEAQSEGKLELVREFVEAYAHFMPDNPRTVWFTWNGKNRCIDIHMWADDDAGYRFFYQTYQQTQKSGVSITDEHRFEHFYEKGYTPSPWGDDRCFLLWEKGTLDEEHEKIECSWPLLCEESDVLFIISNEMKQLYPSAFRKSNGSDGNFFLSFR